MTSLAQALGLDATRAAETVDADASATAAEIIEREKILEEFDAIVIDASTNLKQLFSQMLDTTAYRRAVYVRLVTGQLPAALECKILDHVMGKPIDRIEIADTTKNIDSLTLEELHERQSRTIAAMQKIITAQSAEPRH